MKTTLKDVIKDGLLAGFLQAYPKLGARASILMYHSVGTNKAFFTVAPDEFERQLQYLVEQKFTLLKFSELAARLQKKEAIENMVCVTFDDGYLDNYDTVFPLLKKYNVPISLFLITGLVGKTFTNKEGIILPIINDEQVREMINSGLVEILPHGDTHKKLHNLSQKEAVQEITRSIGAVKNYTNTVPVLYAYPSGRFTKETIELLKQEGMAAAVTVQPGLVKNFDKPYELPRNAVDSKTSFVQFRAKLSHAIEAFQKLR